MCGISCLLSSGTNTEKFDAIKANLKRRGPDHYNEQSTHLYKCWKGSFFGTVLHTQGDQITPQPVFTSKSVFLWNGDVFDGPLIQNNLSNSSDTSLLVDWLESNDGNVLKMVELIQGPYSFLYFDIEKQRLWIGRDVLGRHSLLWDITDTTVFVCSVGHKSVEQLSEVPAAGVFRLQFSDDSVTNISLFPWSHWKLTSWELPPNVLISDTAINYFNFSLKWLNCSEQQDFFSSNGSQNLEIMDNLLLNTQVREYVDKLSNLLSHSVKKRVTIQRNICQNCSNCECSKEHSKIGVLFSGGLDSTLLAFLADKYIPEEEPIDLMNVAFEKNGSFSVPDRRTGLASLNELRSLCPTRTWNFVEINIPQEELKEKRQHHISHLIHPLKTVLDESLGCALWFACRGEGYIGQLPYKSPSKILLLGTGADEQLGGYTRHRNLFKRNGWRDLGQQLVKETIEISKRNLGRDDRIASDHGRQPRFPFLDESLVSFIADMAPWQKCNPGAFPPGIGDKLILRLVAVQLGLRQCATFPKRAFQFGCRIANSKEKGDSCSERL